MSAYLTTPTPMVDQDCLLGALGDVGFGRDKVEVYEEPVALEGYGNDRRVQVAHVIVRRRWVGPASNDIGFERTPLGFRAHVSGYDRHCRASWLASLYEAYQVRERLEIERLERERREEREREMRRLVEAQRGEILRSAREMGYRVKETRGEGKIRLVLVKRVYE